MDDFEGALRAETVVAAQVLCREMRQAGQRSSVRLTVLTQRKVPAAVREQIDEDVERVVRAESGPLHVEPVVFRWTQEPVDWRITGPAQPHVRLQSTVVEPPEGGADRTRTAPAWVDPEAITRPLTEWPPEPAVTSGHGTSSDEAFVLEFRLDGSSPSRHLLHSGAGWRPLGRPEGGSPPPDAVAIPPALPVPRGWLLDVRPDSLGVVLVRRTSARSACRIILDGRELTAGGAARLQPAGMLQYCIEEGAMTVDYTVQPVTGPVGFR